MRSIILFFLFTYLISWTCFITVALLSHETGAIPAGLTTLQKILLFIGTVTPALVSMGILTLDKKIKERNIILMRIVNWKMNYQWYLFAAGYIAIIKIIVSFIYLMLNGSWPPFGNEALYIMLIATLFSTPVQAGEEIGWRGFALPRLSEKFGLVFASIILGILWACWHLPLFFVREADTFGQSFPLYLMQVTGLSVAMAWLYWRTGGSLFLVMLMHAAVNNTKDIVPSGIAGATNTFGFQGSTVGWLTLLLIWLCALFFIYDMRKIKSIKY